MTSSAKKPTARETNEFEAKERFSELLDWVESGREVIIARSGNPIARLVPSKPAADFDQAKQAAAEIRAMSKGMTLGRATLKRLVAEGRL